MAKLHRPVLTNAARPATYEVEAYNERGEMVPTTIAGEHALTLYLHKREIVTLMTLGQAPEALTVGYRRNQRLVGSIGEIAAVQVDKEDQQALTSDWSPWRSVAARILWTHYLAARGQYPPRPDNKSHSCNP